MTSINLGNTRRTELHQTPIKKTKDMTISEPKTAQSYQKIVSSLQDIDPEELFEQFDNILKITEDHSTYQDQQPVTKKLDYQDKSPQGKLSFTPTLSGSSMKKKSMVYQKQNQPRFEGLVLFEVAQEEQTPKKLSVEATKFETPKSRSKKGEEPKCWATQKKVVVQ